MIVDSFTKGSALTQRKSKLLIASAYFLCITTAAGYLAGIRSVQRPYIWSFRGKSRMMSEEDFSKRIGGLAKIGYSGLSSESSAASKQLEKKRITIIFFSTVSVTSGIIGAVLFVFVLIPDTSFRVPFLRPKSAKSGE